MSRELCTGNQALALGAVKAGVDIASACPDTYLTEILEIITLQARAYGLDDFHIEWSSHERAALEVGKGASLAGLRTLVTMKLSGLYAACDLLMSLPYLGVIGGLVLVVADDPGSVSLQTGQDIRQFASFAKIPLLDPSTPEEAFRMIQCAFDVSERYSIPILLRLSTQVCHGLAQIDTAFGHAAHSFKGQLELPQRLQLIATEFYDNSYNLFTNTHATAPPHQGIVAGGTSYEYLLDALKSLNHLGSLRLLKLGAPFPFPKQLALTFLEGIGELLVFEDLEPVFEREFLQLAGRFHLKLKIFGKPSEHISQTKENSVAEIAQLIETLLGLDSFARPIDVTPAFTV